MHIFLDAARIAGGVAFGVLGVYLAFVTFRMWFSGQEAYEANRKASPRGLKSALAGEQGPAKDAESRVSLGLAVNLSTNTLQPQQRLSKEAIDDVIGRRV